jgi:hypothetical protein
MFSVRISSRRLDSKRAHLNTRLGPASAAAASEKLPVGCDVISAEYAATGTGRRDAALRVAYSSCTRLTAALPHSSVRVTE